MPDTFVVLRIYDEMRFQLAVYGVRLAQLDRSRTDYQVVAKVHALSSERQLGVRYLVCADWESPQNPERVIIRTMRKQLGEFFELQLALAETGGGLTAPAGRGGGY